MPRKFTVLLPWLLAGSACLADSSCPALLAQIDAKIRAGGVGNFTLVVVDSAAEARGRVVGSCGQGSKKIVYAQAGTSSGTTSGLPAGPAASATPARRARPPAPDPDSDLLTECKDGSMSVGGQCRFSPPPPRAH